MLLSVFRDVVATKGVSWRQVANGHSGQNFDQKLLFQLDRTDNTRQDLDVPQELFSYYCFVVESTVFACSLRFVERA